MAATKILLLNGSSCETEIPLDELFVLFKQVAQKRATIVVQVIWSGKNVGLDLRRVDPEATFVQPTKFACEKTPVAA